MNPAEIASKRETPYFVISLIFSIFLYLLLIPFFIVLLPLLLLIFCLILFTNLLSNGAIRGNGVKITEQQFPDVYEKLRFYCEQMNIRKIPDMFVIESGGMLNALATKFWGKHMVVVYSEAFELARLNQGEELDFIIAHELSHVKRRHVWKNIFILPARLFPFLSQAYSRSCEYTCDREAAYYTNNPEAAKRALTIFAVGKSLHKEVNLDAYLSQIDTESNAAVWLSELLSSHPNLPKRIQSLSVFANLHDEKIYYQRSGPIVGGLAIFAGAYIGILILLISGSLLFGSIVPDLFEENENISEPAFSYDDDPPIVEGDSTPMVDDGQLSSDVRTLELYDPILLADYDALAAMIENGADLEETDDMQYTALHYAIDFQDIIATEMLLEAGANPETMSNETRPIDLALYFEDEEMVHLLMDYGLDINHFDSYDYTALLYQIDNHSNNMVKLLLENGADPNLLNNDTTALHHALNIENYEGALLLLDYGADPTVEDGDGESVLFLAQLESKEELYEAINLLMDS